MSLSEKLKTKTCPSEVVSVGGIEFRVTGLSLAAVGRLTARHTRKDGKLDGNAVDVALLAECVSDAEDGSKSTAEEWRQVPRAITGPLSAVVLRLNGLDREDVDPKAGEPTES